MPGSIQDAEKKPVQNRPLASSTVDHILWLQSLRCYPWWEGQICCQKLENTTWSLIQVNKKSSKRYTLNVYHPNFFFFAWRWQHRNGKVSAPL